MLIQVLLGETWYLHVASWCVLLKNAGYVPENDSLKFSLTKKWNSLGIGKLWGVVHDMVKSHCALWGVVEPCGILKNKCIYTIVNIISSIFIGSSILNNSGTWSVFIYQLQHPSHHYIPSLWWILGMSPLIEPQWWHVSEHLGFLNRVHGSLSGDWN